MKESYKWEVLALLWIAYFVNQADRQVFNVVLPLIRADLHLTDMQIGLIATIFNLTFARLVPLSGYIGDVYNRKWIIVGSILFWSVATMLTGLSSSVWMLVLMRSIATGGGEAFFAPANYSLLAGYHKSTRAFAMSVHQTSYYAGVIVSSYLAGYIGERYGWRNAFYIFGAVGLVHGLVLVFRLKDNRFSEQANAPEGVGFSEAIKVIFRTPTALSLTIAFCGLIFVLVGYLTWTPTYLYEKFGMSLSMAGFNSMFYTHLSAFAGILIAGKFSDRLAGRKPAVRLLMQGAGLFLAAPFIVMIGSSGTLMAVYTGFAGFGFARAFFDANTYAILYDVIPEKFHSSASGIMITIGFAVGSFAPLVLGYLKPVLGLSFGISALAAVWVLSGILLIVAYQYFFETDYLKNQDRQNSTL